MEEEGELEGVERSGPAEICPRPQATLSHLRDSQQACYRSIVSKAEAKRKGNKSKQGGRGQRVLSKGGQSRGP